MGRVVDNRISLKAGSRGKPTVCKLRKAAVRDAGWRVSRTPPGSESGACSQRGNSGTWESHLSPCHRTRSGGPGDHRPWHGRGLPLDHEPSWETTNPRQQARYREGERQAKRPARGTVADITPALQKNRRKIMAVSQPRYSKSDRLLARHPDAQVWLSRVGSRYARRFSACSRRGVA